MTNTQLDPKTIKRSVSEIIEAVESLDPNRIDAALSRIEAKDVPSRDIGRIREAYFALNLDPHSYPSGNKEVSTALDNVASWLPTKGIDAQVVTDLKEALRLKSPKMTERALHAFPDDLSLTPEQAIGINGMLAVFDQANKDLPEGDRRDSSVRIAEKVRFYLDMHESPSS